MQETNGESSNIRSANGGALTAASASPLTPRPKNIVICLDGTGNQIGGSRLPTNVGKIYQMLELQLPDQQIGYYDPGVGTLPASTAHGRVGRWLSQGMQLAFGRGMRANLTQAYTWLMQHYQPTDKVYIFGFSRGAYTARALAGMLIRPGLLRPGSDNLIDYAMAEYASKRQLTPASRERIADFADSFCWGTQHSPMSPDWSAITKKPAANKEDIHSVPIEYMGLWDTVKAAGFTRFAGDVRWAFTDELWNAKSIRHAVSLDERRFPYKYESIERREGVEEVWFAGVHSDIGGTFDNYDLATIAFKWIVDGVADRLILREGHYAKTFSPQLLNPCGPIHEMGPWWKLMPHRPRVPSADALYHESVRERRGTYPDYLPFLDEPFNPHQWQDSNWKQLENAPLTLDKLNQQPNGSAKSPTTMSGSTGSRP